MSKKIENMTISPVYADDMYTELIHSGIYIRKYENGKSMSLGIEILLPTLGDVADYVLNEYSNDEEWHIENTYGECFAVIKGGIVKWGSDYMKKSK